MIREVIEMKEAESRALHELASVLNMSADNVMRAALRLYQTSYHRAVKGQRIAWTDANGNIVPEEVGGCMGDDTESHSTFSSEK